MGTWRRRLELLVASVDLESEEVRGDDGVLEGLAVGLAVAGVGWNWQGTVE
jgi:hypothetical protein